MRTPSLNRIILLCTIIVVVDAFAFFWLLSITRWIQAEGLRLGIHILFWVFTVALVTGILLLKYRIDHLHPYQRQRVTSSLYGLTVSSILPKFIFVIAISILHYSNSALTHGEAGLWVALAGLFAGFLPFGVVVYGILRAAYRYKVHKIEVEFNQLPSAFDGLRIVQISDIHLGSFGKNFHLLEKAVKIINHLKPDVIVFTGDLVNNFAWELKGWTSVLDKLEARLGKYSVLGNHDYGDYSEWKSPEAKQSNLDSIVYFHRKIGFELLNNEARVLEENGQKLAIVGVENWGHPPFPQHGDLAKAMEEVQSLPFKILLSHDPTHWREEVAGQTDISITFSGHTHGMQAAFRWRNKEWSPIKYRYKHWAGLYEEDGQYLYVNRGLGWLGFPGRLGMRPEITMVELRSGNRD